MPDVPPLTLSAWLGLAVDAPIDALPRTLRADLARAALADEQPALALALARPDAGLDGPLWATDVAAAALLALGWPAQALTQIEARLTRAPTIAAVRLQAHALLGLSGRERALAAVRELVARQPDAVSAWTAVGDVALAAGEVDEAAVAYAQARELSPRSTGALVGLARVALVKGRPGEARALLEPLTEEGGSAVLAALADAAAAEGDRERAAALRARLADWRTALRAGWRARVAALLGETEAAAATDSPTAAARDGAEVAPAELPAAEEPASPALLRALREYFGFDAFRPGQAAVCQAVLDGRDTLAVMPTGAGKSLCFQLPAMILNGVTLVISPLVALMKDQLDGLPPPVYERATLLNSTLDAAELMRRVEALAAGQYRLVYVAPERLGQPTLLAALRRAGVARVVVDEAHCVSAWGHDFRPDYLTIGDALARLGHPPILAVTATAPPAVRADVSAGLGRPLAVLQTPLFRPNLRFEVQSLPNVEAKIAALVDLCRSEPGSVVVYVNSRQRTEELARLLRGRGVRAAHYHAGLEPDERARVQDDFMLDRTRVIVATVAFGMGVDKANIRLVVHFSLPESLEAYVQESGRAGRDGRPARCVLLAAPADKANLTRWLKAERLSLDDLRAVYRQVKRLLDTAETGLVDDRALGLALGGEDGTDNRARVALGLLERAGLLERLGTAPAEVTVARLAGGRSLPVAFRVAKGPEDAARLGRLSVGQGTYGGLDLAGLLGLPASELEPWLLDAQEAGWLRYRALQRGLAVRLESPPADATARLAALLAEYAAHQDRRIADIVDYADSLGCRHARIARHFGQRLDPPCGACDRCEPGEARQPLPAQASATRDADSLPTATPTLPPAAAILGCLAELPFSPGRRGLVRILVGSEVAAVGPDRTQYHGALRGLTIKAVERVVDRLQAEGYLVGTPARTRDGREFNALALTPRGRTGPPEWDRPFPAAPSRLREPSASRSSRGDGLAALQSAPAGLPDGGEPDPDRFERLRAWRRQEAAAAAIAPFMVFSDATLRALASLAPDAVDRDTLALVPGIGAAKLARYGDALVALLHDDEPLGRAHGAGAAADEA
jgi:ATP-dependent DNA helicase RecQ